MPSPQWSLLEGDGTEKFHCDIHGTTKAICCLGFRQCCSSARMPAPSSPYLGNIPTLYLGISTTLDFTTSYPAPSNQIQQLLSRSHVLGILAAFNSVGLSCRLPCVLPTCPPLPPLWIHHFLSGVSTNKTLGSLFSFLTYVKMTHKFVFLTQVFSLSSKFLHSSLNHLIPGMAEANSPSSPCSPRPLLSISTLPLLLLSVNGFTIHLDTMTEPWGHPGPSCCRHPY